MKHARALVLAFGVSMSSPAAAGPMVGIGSGGLDLFPHGFFPEGSGPFMLGAGYSHGVQAGEGGAYLRFGVGIVEYESYESLAAPQWMVGLEMGVHLLDESVFTIGPTHQRGIGPFLVGGSVALASSEREDTSLGIVFVPEVSLPLRFMIRRRFTPSAIVFARFELAATVRSVFDDRMVAGLSIALY